MDHTTNPDTQLSLADIPAGDHVLRVDYTNKSAQIINADGHTAAIYSEIYGREAAVRRIAVDG
jgi:ribosomal protein L2